MFRGLSAKVLEVLFFSVLLALCSSSARAQTRLHLYDLVTFQFPAQAASEVQVNSVNDNGNFAGTFKDAAGNLHTYLWTRAGGFSDITASLSGVDFRILKINNNNDILGQFRPSVGAPTQNFIRSGQGHFMPLTGPNQSLPFLYIAADLAHNGRVAGTEAGQNEPQLKIAPITQNSYSNYPASGLSRTLISAMNNNGVMVGEAYVNGVKRAAKFTPNGASILQIPLSTQSYARDINDNGDIFVTAEMVGTTVCSGQQSCWLDYLVHPNGRVEALPIPRFWRELSKRVSAVGVFGIQRFNSFWVPTLYIDGKAIRIPALNTNMTLDKLGTGLVISKNGTLAITGDNQVNGQRIDVVVLRRRADAGLALEIEPVQFNANGHQVIPVNSAMTIRVSGGTPGARVAVYAYTSSGQLITSPLTVSSFDNNGQLSHSLTIPGSLLGQDSSLQAISLDSRSSAGYLLSPRRRAEFR